MFGIDPTEDRYSIQALRAHPPLLARAGGRRGTFTAALGQWEALLIEARNAPAETAPLPMFYALAQAGLALCAARLDGDWRGSSHGLTVGRPAEPLSETTLTPNTRDGGAFGLFCDATGSARLTKPTTLGALWASNPRLRQVAALSGTYARTIEMEPQGSDDFYFAAMVKGHPAADLPPDPVEATQALQSRLTDYPGALGASVPGNQIARPGTAYVQWTGPEGVQQEVRLHAPGLGAQPSSGCFLWPKLNAAGNQLGYPALWWATLLALSDLARYHPGEWSQALYHEAESAVPLRHALDRAAVLLPWLLVAELTSSAPSQPV